MGRWRHRFLFGACLMAAGGLLLSHASSPPVWLRALFAASGGWTAVCLKKWLSPKGASVTHGSAAFAGDRDLRTLSFPGRASLPQASILLGTRKNALVALPPPYTTQHGVIIGGSGTGKSFSFFLPNLALAGGVSRVVTDPKGELWDYTSGYHARATRYAPTEPEASAGFNWMPLCRDARLASLCARTIVEAGETTRQEAPWPDLETAFLAALFSHASSLSVPTPLTAYQLLTRRDPDALMKEFLLSASPVAREQAVIFLQTHERMRGSITPVLAAKLQFLRDAQVARFTSSSFAAPDFGRLRVFPEALYWCAPEQDMALLRPLSALFFTLVLDQLAYERVAADAVPVHLYLDEFANIGIIPHYETTISLARGRGLSIWHGLQSLSQLEARYGKANAQTILTNCATKIALSGLDFETAQYVSRSLGEGTVSRTRSSWQWRRLSLFSTSVTTSMQEHARPLLTSDEVRRLGEEEALVITGNRRPLRIRKYRYDEAPRAASAHPLGDARALPGWEAATGAGMPEMEGGKPPELPAVFRARSRKKAPKGSVRRNRTTVLPKP